MKEFLSCPDFVLSEKLSMIFNIDKKRMLLNSKKRYKNIKFSKKIQSFKIFYHIKYQNYD